MAKKKSYVQTAKIKKHLRRLSIQRPEYTKAKNRAKIDRAVFKCENPDCGQVIYDGKSKASFEKLKLTYPDIIMEKPEMDHDIEVVSAEKGWQGWDEYINRLWCGPDELTLLCKSCHKKTSKKEMEKRRNSGSLKRGKKEKKS